MKEQVTIEAKNNTNKTSQNNKDKNLGKPPMSKRVNNSDSFQIVPISGQTVLKKPRPKVQLNENCKYNQIIINYILNNVPCPFSCPTASR